MKQLFFSENIASLVYPPHLGVRDKPRNRNNLPKVRDLCVQQNNNATVSDGVNAEHRCVVIVNRLSKSKLWIITTEI